MTAIAMTQCQRWTWTKAVDSQTNHGAPCRHTYIHAYIGPVGAGWPSKRRGRRGPVGWGACQRTCGPDEQVRAGQMRRAHARSLSFPRWQSPYSRGTIFGRRFGENREGGGATGSPGRRGKRPTDDGRGTSVDCRSISPAASCERTTDDGNGIWTGNRALPVLRACVACTWVRWETQQRSCWFGCTQRCDRRLASGLRRSPTCDSRSVLWGESCFSARRLWSVGFSLNDDGHRMEYRVGQITEVFPRGQSSNIWTSSPWKRIWTFQLFVSLRPLSWETGESANHVKSNGTVQLYHISKGRGGHKVKQQPLFDESQRRTAVLCRTQFGLFSLAEGKLLFASGQSCQKMENFPTLLLTGIILARIHDISRSLIPCTSYEWDMEIVPRRYMSRKVATQKGPCSWIVSQPLREGRDSTVLWDVTLVLRKSDQWYQAREICPKKQKGTLWRPEEQ